MGWGTLFRYSPARQAVANQAQDAKLCSNHGKHIITPFYYWLEMNMIAERATSEALLCTATSSMLPLYSSGKSALFYNRGCHLPACQNHAPCFGFLWIPRRQREWLPPVETPQTCSELLKSHCNLFWGGRGGELLNLCDGLVRAPVSSWIMTLISFILLSWWQEWDILGYFTKNYWNLIWKSKR